MVTNIANLWRGEPLMKKAVSSFIDMLKSDEQLINEAWDAVLGKADIEEIRQPLYDRDKSVNRNEHEVRRLLVEHLTLRPGADISGCLVLMSLVKDAERIGDYAKNVFEVGVMMEGKSKEMKYIDSLSSIHSKLSANMPKLRSAFTESSEKLAKEILKQYTPIKVELNKMMEDLLEDQLSTREAISTALAARYLKRINSHISNIASGVVYPLDQIDFVSGDIFE